MDFRILQGILCSNFKSLEHKDELQKTMKNKKESLKKSIFANNPLDTIVEESKIPTKKKYKTVYSNLPSINLKNLDISE